MVIVIPCLLLWMPGGWKGNSVTSDPSILSPLLIQALLSIQCLPRRSLLVDDCLFIWNLVMLSTIPLIITVINNITFFCPIFTSYCHCLLDDVFKSCMYQTCYNSVFPIHLSFSVTMLLYHQFSVYHILVVSCVHCNY